jgi:hypothetical protein
MDDAIYAVFFVFIFALFGLLMWVAWSENQFGTNFRTECAEAGGAAIISSYETPVCLDTMSIINID